MSRLLEPDPTFDYRIASPKEILERASRLEGHVLGDIAGARFNARQALYGKGEAGAAVELYFGIPANSRREADFPGAGIELKVVPIIRSTRSLRVKERTVISMIDYKSLVLEQWHDASVRKKLKILFVYFEHIPDEPKATYPILAVLIWRPDETVEAFLEADWERVRRKVRLGLAHELSESDGRIMGPCTKGVGGEASRSQPFSSRPAKPRAFALKPTFTRDLFQQRIRPTPAESLVANGVLDRVDRFEEQLLARFARFEGVEVGEVARRLGVPISDAKSFAAQVLRRTFGAKDFRSEIREFQETGLTPRVARVDKNLKPYEATSFPAFRYRELLEESWEDSDLLSRVEYMLIVPVFGETRKTPQRSCLFGRPVFWRPTAHQLELIRREWELFRAEIREGRAEDLTSASGTVAIHVRPHARNASDVDIAPIVGRVVKKSFWLNQPFVQNVLAHAHDGSQG